jgi:hypothetical protein
MCHAIGNQYPQRCGEFEVFLLPSRPPIGWKQNIVWQQWTPKSTWYKSDKILTSSDQHSFTLWYYESTLDFSSGRGKHEWFPPKVKIRRMSPCHHGSCLMINGLNCFRLHATRNISSLHNPIKHRNLCTQLPRTEFYCGTLHTALYKWSFFYFETKCTNTGIL